MEQASSILFKLIRSAFGGSNASGIPSNYNDWEQVISLSAQHGMSAIALDGYQIINSSDRGVPLTLENPQHKKNKMKLCFDALRIEEKYKKQFASATTLVDLFSRNDIQTLILKGFALSECYPIPAHRPCCDLDCYLSDYSKGKEVLADNGISVEDLYYKHSSFKFKGLHVENHRYFTSWRGAKKGVEFELLLRTILKEKPLIPIGDTKMYKPNALFSALFLTKHAHMHFLEEDGLSLKHICDWGLFLKKHKTEFDWDRYYEVCKTFGMDRFVDSVTKLSEYICFNENTKLSSEDYLLLNNIIALGNRNHNIKYEERIKRSLHVLSSGWKFKLFSNENVFEYIVRKSFGVFSEKIGIKHDI